MENIGTIIGLVVLLIIIIWIIVKFYSFYGDKKLGLKNYTTLVKDKINGNIPNTISGNTIPTSGFSNEYALSFWMHVDDYTYRYGKEKIVMIRGASESVANPMIVLADKSNTLMVKIALQTQDPNYSLGSIDTPDTTTKSMPTTMPTPTSTVVTTAPTPEAFNNVLDSVGDNRAPPTASLYNNDYFEAVSGNVVSSDGFLDYGLNEGVEGLYMSVNSGNTSVGTHNITDITGVMDESPSNLMKLATAAAPSNMTVTTKESFATDTTKASISVGICSVDELPLQRWVHVVVSVYNNIVDIYIDGKLSSSCVLKGFPLASTSDLRIVPEGGFSGSIANVVSVNSALNPSEVQKLYNDGPIYSEGFFGTIKSYFTSITTF